MLHPCAEAAARLAVHGTLDPNDEHKHGFVPLRGEEGESAKPAPCDSTAFALDGA
jgi:hypothetical protein